MPTRSRNREACSPATWRRGMTGFPRNILVASNFAAAFRARCCQTVDSICCPDIRVVRKPQRNETVLIILFASKRKRCLVEKKSEFPTFLTFRFSAKHVSNYPPTSCHAPPTQRCGPPFITHALVLVPVLVLVLDPVPVRVHVLFGPLSEESRSKPPPRSSARRRSARPRRRFPSTRATCGLGQCAL